MHLFPVALRSSCVLLSSSPAPASRFLFFFFNDTATTEIYTLSLHDALPICHARDAPVADAAGFGTRRAHMGWQDRKSTRLNSSHVRISYAVFCLKKKKNTC